MARKREECCKYSCRERPFRIGLCEWHYKEYEEREAKRADALEVLNGYGRIDGEPIKRGPLHDEFEQLRKWWDEVCWASQMDREHAVLKEETQYAVEWCIALAGHIADEERELRQGKDVNVPSHYYLRRHLWDRFENLEKGLMSNGVPRPTEK